MAGSEVRAARVYLRVSTDEQDLTRQESIVAGARAAGFYVAAVYREKASGARPDRPELLRMVADLQPGEVVVAEKIDRISRLPLQEAELLVDAIRGRGARLAVPGIVDLSDLVADSAGVARIVLEAVQDMLLRVALQTARDEVAALDDDSAPLLLFLDRLETLDAKVRGRAGKVSSAFTLERHEEPIKSSPVAASVVTLNGAHWLLVRDQAPEALMQQAVDDGVKAKQLHSSWKDWSGVGEVGLAVPLEHEISSPRLYTFLPMGEGATAPLQGHLHGSFFPSSNRKALDASVALNRLLLTQAVTLAAASVRWLADRDTGRSHAALTAISRAKASVDLLVWTNPSRLTAAKSPGERLDLPALSAAEVARLGEQEFASVPVIPCAVTLGGLLSIGWRCPMEVRATFEVSATFNLLAVAKHGATISPPIGSS